METPPPPPAHAATSPLPPIAPSKLRLMCSYGGHIVPRPHDKSLFYAGGETRIIAVDRRSTAASLGSLSAYLSRAVFGNRPFLLKYQLPREDLDSLISVVTDEDVANMLEEHDRISPAGRLRLFLFPVKPESVGTALLDQKSNAWFSDALKGTRIVQKGHSADAGSIMGVTSDLETPGENATNSGGGESRVAAESVLLETSSSFGSSCSSVSMSNLPLIGKPQCDGSGLKLLDRKSRVPSSASFESENSVASTTPPPKAGIQEPIDQLRFEESSENETQLMQNSVQVLGYSFPQPPDGKKQQCETQLMQGGLHYVPQFAGPVPISPYYPIYQMPMHPHHIPGQSNQPYPVYLVPIKPAQQHNMSMALNSFDANTTSFSSIQPPLHGYTGAVDQAIPHKGVFGAQMAELATQGYNGIPSAYRMASVPSDQGQPVMQPPQPQIASKPCTTDALLSVSPGTEFDEDIAYSQIYRSQPPPPVLPSQCQMATNESVILLEP